MKVDSLTWKDWNVFYGTQERVSLGPPKPVHYPPVRILRVLAMPQPFFLELSGLGIHRSNLLKLGVEIYSYNDHVRLLSPEPVGWLSHHQLYSSGGADIVMESITLIDRKVECNGLLMEAITLKSPGRRGQ